MKAIIFLCKVVSQLLVKFANSLKNNSNYFDYDIFIIPDKLFNDQPPSDIQIINIDAKLSEKYGFKGSVLYFLDRACARDKALYYFSYLNIEYEWLWFIEEDVFIPTLDTIYKIDKQYDKNVDLLCNKHMIDNKEFALWKTIPLNIPLPWANCMICAVRISNNLLQKIKEFANQYSFLILDEVLFPTVAIHNNMNIINPPELSGIVYRENWVYKKIKTDGLYHPIKSLLIQNLLRKNLKF